MCSGMSVAGTNSEKVRNSENVNVLVHLSAVQSECPRTFVRYNSDLSVTFVELSDKRHALLTCQNFCKQKRQRRGHPGPVQPQVYQ